METALRRAFAGVGVSGSAIHSTVRAGDEAVLTRRAIDEVATTIVAVGGDGTWSKVASAILESRTDCRLGVVAAGTGNDFAKSLGVPANDFAASARLADDGSDARVDVGRLDDEWFVNAVGFGFDVAVLENAARVRWLRGPLLYAYTALHQLLSYDGIPIACDDNVRSALPKRLLLVIANGRCFGGAFQIAPDASLEDGLLDLVAIPDASSLERLKLFTRAMGGLHVKLPSVELRQARSFSLQFDAAPAYDLDGELRQARSNVIQVECVPGALRVVGAMARADAANRVGTIWTRILRI